MTPWAWSLPLSSRSVKKETLSGGSGGSESRTEDPWKKEKTPPMAASRPARDRAAPDEPEVTLLVELDHGPEDAVGRVAPVQRGATSDRVPRLASSTAIVPGRIIRNGRGIGET